MAEKLAEESQPSFSKKGCRSMQETGNLLQRMDSTEGRMELGFQNSMHPKADHCGRYSRKKAHDPTRELRKLLQKIDIGMKEPCHSRSKEDAKHKEARDSARELRRLLRKLHGRMKDANLKAEQPSTREVAKLLQRLDLSREPLLEAGGDSINAVNCHVEFRTYSLLKGMAAGKHVMSDKFSAGGQEWAMLVYPSGKSAEYDSRYISVFIGLMSEAMDVTASFELTMLDQSENDPPQHRCSSHFDRPLVEPYLLKHRGSMWGYKRFYKREALESSRYLKGDCLKFKCSIAVTSGAKEAPPHLPAVSSAVPAQLAVCDSGMQE